MGLLRPDAPTRPSGNGSRFFDPSSFTFPALTAAATKVVKRDGTAFKRLEQPWQRRALQYYEQTPEAHFAATYQGNMLSQIRLYPAKLDGTEREETDDEKVVEILNRVHDPGSPERSELQRSFGKLMLLTGEGYLLVTGTGQKDEGEEEQWEFVSTAELRVDADGRLRRFKAPGGTGIVYERQNDEEEDKDFKILDANEAVAYRMWRPSPKHSAMADSPMQGVLDLFEELLLLQMAVRARVRSRLSSAGLLILDESIGLPVPPDVKADPRNLREDPLFRAMTTHMMKPIADEGTAAAVVPFFLRTGVEEGRSIKDLALHLRFSDPNETYRETGLRAECIERIATGMDFPAEILKGTGDMTHWNAWQVDEQVAKTLIFPVCALLCSSITDSYFRPALRDNGVEDFMDYVVWYDPAAIITHPDQSANARELYDRGELTGELMRDAHGWSGEEDKPSDEDVIKWMAKDKRDPQLFLTGQPTPQAPPLGPDGQPLPPEQMNGGPPEGGPNASPIDSAQTKKVPPPEPQVASAAGSKTEMIMGAAELALDRARELAGARVRARARSCEECFEGMEEIPNSALVAALGTEKLGEIGVPPSTELVAGAGAALAQTLQRLGVGPDWGSAIGDAVEAHAARTLFDESASMPVGFRNLVTRTERT